MQPCSAGTLGDMARDAFSSLQCCRNASVTARWFRIRIVRGFAVVPNDRATINARSNPIIGARLEW
jgi:hypothetical protein